VYHKSIKKIYKEEEEEEEGNFFEKTKMVQKFSSIKNIHIF